MAFLLKELEGELGEALIEITSYRELVLIEREEKEYEIWAEPDYLHLIDLDINIFNCYLCQYDKEDDEYLSDFNLCIFYDNKTGKEVYWEHFSSAGVCIHNYFSLNGLVSRYGNLKIDELRCAYILDNGFFLRKKVLHEPDVEFKGYDDI